MIYPARLQPCSCIQMRIFRLRRWCSEMILLRMMKGLSSCRRQNLPCSALSSILHRHWYTNQQILMASLCKFHVRRLRTGKRNNLTQAKQNNSSNTSGYHTPNMSIPAHRGLRVCVLYLTPTAIILRPTSQTKEHWYPHQPSYSTAKLQQ